jgi:hypothetical protein
MYVCQCCGGKSKPREKRHLHVRYKVVPHPHGGYRLDVARETPCCLECKEVLDKAEPRPVVPPPPPRPVLVFERNRHVG